MASIENVDCEILFVFYSLYQFCHCVTNREEYLNSAEHTLLLNLFDISGSVWRNSIKVSVTMYMLLTRTQQITNSQPTVGRLLACVLA